MYILAERFSLMNIFLPEITKCWPTNLVDVHSYVTRNRLPAPNVESFDEESGGFVGAPDEESSVSHTQSVNNPSPYEVSCSIACLHPLTRLIARSLIPISRGTSDPFLTRSRDFIIPPSANPLPRNINRFRVWMLRENNIWGLFAQSGIAD